MDGDRCCLVRNRMNLLEKIMRNYSKNDEVKMISCQIEKTEKNLILAAKSFAPEAAKT